ncbi:sigma-70 region 4 domain-containing protein [Sphingomonas sanguinis]|uniref:Sigma-70 region 4 domain-containing protein n=1 Tax=Sphingomonas sanguinis TaxID=33051 RepID=A0ABU5LMA8_9SPHN|nr:sigma-70 region 4 domain-containing protein [Sphingomonas sanguinis]MDZ7281056.1 sigma-70 region 4 domain-containing protein [Sphingomonas sanguinis]
MTRDRHVQARWRAWNALPNRDRAIFASVRIEGLDYDEAARRHGCTAQDVERVIVRVLVALVDADDAPP